MAELSLGTEARSAPVRELSSRFEAEFGAAPDGIWAAPGRVNLIGEHTDYNGGFSLPVALDRCTRVAVRRRADRLLRLRSQQAEAVELRWDELAPGRVSGWAAYIAGCAWALRDTGAAATGFDLLVDGDVPLGAGLSSSAALSCASTLALAELWGCVAPRLALARWAQRAEAEFAGVPCGLLDQIASLCSSAGHALLIDFETLELENLELNLSAAGLELWIIDTRHARELAAGAYRARRESCEEAARALGVSSLRHATEKTLELRRDRLPPECQRRARHVLAENARVLAAAQLLRDLGVGADPARLGELGPLLSRSHASLRDDFEVSVPALDVAVASAAGAGALGARLVGGGFGGSVLALVQRGRGAEVQSAVHAAFQERGWAAPALLSVQPGSPASRLG
ncbi:MAG TPA: galactokinase [Polyangiaceae bacterium]|nr:galactokinase [Polyangiaceae bacterium]